MSQRVFAGISLMVIVFLGILISEQREEVRRENAALKQSFMGPAATLVTLSSGAKFKVVEMEGRDFLVAEFAGVGAGMSNYTPSTCETFVTKPNSEREYGVRFNCP